MFMFMCNAFAAGEIIKTEQHGEFLQPACCDTVTAPVQVLQVPSLDTLHSMLMWQQRVPPGTQHRAGHAGQA